MSLCNHSEGRNVQRKHLTLLGHQLLYVEILNGADGSCKQTISIYLFLLTQHSLVQSLKACSTGILSGGDITFLSSGNISRSNKLLLLKSMERCE